MSLEYELLDSGNTRKLEKFGPYVLDRPCSQAVWSPQLAISDWKKAHARFSREGGKAWTFQEKIPSQWEVHLSGIKFIAKPTDFGHIGIFPEHHYAWSLIEKQLAVISEEKKKQMEFLNLFAYTGGASLALARSGTQVCHLDASKKSVAWASDNAKLNKLNSIRWIIEDAEKYLLRELKRGRRYDGIILDPPSFGRGSKQEVFKIDNELQKLLNLCHQLLKADAEFLFLSCHTPGYTPQVLTNLMHQLMDPTHKKGQIQAGEMLLTSKNKNTFPIPSGAFCVWKKQG